MQTSCVDNKTSDIKHPEMT